MSSSTSVDSERLRLLKRKCKCGQICSIKISRSDKNKNRLYYGCDFGCGFILWCAPINDPRGYSNLYGLKNWWR